MNIGDKFLLKKDFIKSKSKTIEKGLDVIYLGYSSNSFFDKMYYFKSKSNNFKLHRTWLEKYIETKQERRKRIIKKVLNK